MSGAGWIGLTDQVLYFLSVVGADRDTEGRYLIAGESESDAPTTFLGAGVEMVVPAGACYLVKGHKCNLAAGLSSTSYGMSVVVIS